MCHIFLFIPLYFVWNFLMKWLSLTSNIMGSFDFTFSTIDIFISASWCPGLLKCSPVALSTLLFLMYPLCSFVLNSCVFSVSPMYCSLHLLQYTTFLVWQLTSLSISWVNLLAVDFIFLPSCTYGHVRQCHS